VNVRRRSGTPYYEPLGSHLEPEWGRLLNVGEQAKRALDLYDVLSERFEARVAALEQRVAELEAR